MSNLVKSTYQDIVVIFTEDAWINATAAAEKYGKRVQNWLDNQETKDYIEALADFHNHSKGSDLKVPKEALLKTKRGKNGGTWLHPDLAVPFARWIDIRFGVWCDQHIKQILKGTHPHYDWKKMRHQATASYKVMGQILQMTRERLGKTCAPHHFSNEARMINWALSGKFCGVDRGVLSPGDLDLLAKLENMNTILIGCGASYADRKKELEQFAAEQRFGHVTAIEENNHE